MSVSTKIVIDGGKNSVVTLSGSLREDIASPSLVLKFEDLAMKPKSVRIDAVVFAIQEKMGVVLWWELDKERELILPLESRGRFNFEEIQGLHSPKEGVLGISMSTFEWKAPVKHFLIMLDLTKQ